MRSSDAKLLRGRSRGHGILVVILLVFAGVAVAADTNSNPDLRELLTRLDRTARLYAERARSFTCEETIRWDKKGETGQRKFGYVVSLDENENFDDYRTQSRRRKDSAVASRVRPEDYDVPAYLRSAYLWVFIFKRDRWPSHRYEIIGEDKLFGRPAIVIRFESIPPHRKTRNNWYGTAWVDRETALLLKVAAHGPEDHEEMQRIERHRAGEAVSDWIYFVEETVTEFKTEERGMRFPSRVELRQVNYDFMRGLSDWNKQERTTLWVYQTYRDYRFFEVESSASVEAEPTEEK